MTHVTHRLGVALANVLREQHAEEPVHFHTGDHEPALRLRGPALQLTELDHHELVTEQRSDGSPRPGGRS